MPASGVPTRQRILAEATRAFGARGYGQTSLDDVAEAAGIRKQSLLYHFPSKDDLFAAAAIDAARSVGEALDEALGPDPAGLDRLEALVRGVYRLADQRPEVVAMIREAARTGPPASDRVAQAMKPLADAAVRWLSDAMDTGHLRRLDPRVALLTIYSAVVGHLTESSVKRALLDGKARKAAERELVAFLRAALTPVAT